MRKHKDYYIRILAPVSSKAQSVRQAFPSRPLLAPSALLALIIYLGLTLAFSRGYEASAFYIPHSMDSSKLTVYPKRSSCRTTLLKKKSRHSSLWVRMSNVSVLRAL